MNDLLFTLRHAPRLESLHLSNLEFTGLDAVGWRPESPAGRGAHRPLQLDLTSIPVDAQPFILSALHHRPSVVNFLGCVTESTATWNSILHPTAAAHLGPIHFTTLCLSPTSLELQTDAENTEERTSCSITLGAFGPHYLNLLSRDTNLFDLSQVHTLQLDKIPPVGIQQDFVHLQRFRITKVVACRSWPECSANLIETLLHLRELHIVATDLMSFGTPTRFVEELIGGLRRRREAQIDGIVPAPLERGVLDQWHGLVGNVEVLRREIHVDVV